jgi:2-oxoglutarate ferredoxin oxidoreductase subunit alpha
MDRGKVLDAEALERLGSAWGRYKDVDADGIPYRTLPGNESRLAAYFTRGTGHNENAHYSERPDDWERNMDRLTRKFETARSLVPGPVVTESAGAEVGIISLGSNDPAVLEARDLLQAAGIETSYLRLRALPISDAVRDFIRRYDRVYVVENNHDGQLHKILVSEEPAEAGKIISLARSNGLSLSADWISTMIQQEGVR